MYLRYYFFVKNIKVINLLRYKIVKLLRYKRNKFVFINKHKNINVKIL